MDFLISNLLGILFLKIILIFVLYFSTKNPEIRYCILTAFVLRVILILAEQYGFLKLPDGNLHLSDANRFELIAREFSNQNNFLFILELFKDDSLLISRIIAIFYYIIGESVMIAKGISAAIGTASVYLVYKLTYRLWDKDSAKKACWVTALFPTLILYSVITLREVYFIFFLLLALISILKYMEKKSFFLLIQVILFFYITSLFHGPAYIGLFVFILYLSFTLIKKQFFKIIKLKIDINSFSIILILLLPLILYVNAFYSIPYIGSFEELMNYDRAIDKANVGFRDTAEYPTWLHVNNNFELFPKILIKILYFLYSPFIWDISEVHHIIGVFDGMIYMLLTFYLIKNWKSIWSNPIARIFLLILFVYVIIYGFGIGNFGTAIRHRSKFVVILIVLAAPKLIKAVFKQRKLNS